MNSTGGSRLLIDLSLEILILHFEVSNLLLRLAKLLRHHAENYFVPLDESLLGSQFFLDCLSDVGLVELGRLLKLGALNGHRLSVNILTCAFGCNILLLCD